MKQFKLSVVIILLFAVLIIPSIVLATWWNPVSWNWNIFSWFSKPQVNIVQQIQNQTAGWKTYKNTVYNFSVSYPSNFSEIATYTYLEGPIVAENIENGASFSSPDVFSYGPDIAKMGITGRMTMGMQMTNPKYSISITNWEGPFYLTTVAPWIDPVSCKQVRSDPNMPLTVKKERFGDYAFCIIDQTASFLKLARSTKNNLEGLSELFAYRGPEIDYVISTSNATSSNLFLTIRLFNNDYGYQIAQTILNGGNVENGIKNMETDIVTREQILNQLVSTLKFTNISTSCAPHWICGWGPCENNSQSETAVDSNNCGLPPSNVNITCPALARLCPPTTTQQSITITSPSGGEQWKVGETHNITWTSSEVTGNVTIWRGSTTGGYVAPNQVATVPVSSDTYSWVVDKYAVGLDVIQIDSDSGIMGTSKVFTVLTSN